MYSHAEIKAIMPHRYPMLLVDRIVEMKRWVSIVGQKSVTGTEGCFARLGSACAAERYAYPASLIIESFGQTGGVLVNEKRRHDERAHDTVMLFAGLSHFRFRKDVFPGDVMEHHVRLDKDLPDFAILSGEVRVGGDIVAEAESIIVAYRPADTIPAASGKGRR